MVRVCDPSFGKHHQTIIDHAVGGGILCGLRGEKSLRDFLTDISISLKPQQDFIIQALEELRRNTEMAVAALEESGSPFKHTVVRNLRTHHAAYVTFTKVLGVVCFGAGIQSIWVPRPGREGHTYRSISFGN